MKQLCLPYTTLISKPVNPSTPWIPYNMSNAPSTELKYINFCGDAKIVSCKLRENGTIDYEVVYSIDIDSAKELVEEYLENDPT